MNEQLQGLLIPDKEVAVDTTFLLVLVLSLVFLTLFLWRLWRSNKRRKQPSEVAQRGLQKLISLPCDATTATQARAIELTRLLCMGLGVTRLDQFQAKDNKQWNKLCEQINMACYSRLSPSDKVSCIDLNRLIEEAMQWLQTYDK